MSVNATKTSTAQLPSATRILKTPGGPNPGLKNESVNPLVENFVPRDGAESKSPEELKAFAKHQREFRAVKMRQLVSPTATELAIPTNSAPVQNNSPKKPQQPANNLNLKTFTLLGALVTSIPCATYYLVVAAANPVYTIAAALVGGSAALIYGSLKNAQNTPQQPMNRPIK